MSNGGLRLRLRAEVTAKPSRGPGRISARIGAARASARRAAVPAAVILLAAAIVQACLTAVHAPHLPPAIWMAGGALAALRTRDIYEAVHVRRHSGRRAARKRRKFQGPASAREIHRLLSVHAARRRAKVTRPGFGGRTRRLAAVAAGVLIGTGGTPARMLMGTHEDFYLIYAPPRRGKTGWLAGVALDAPGACLATSTRVDIYAHTVIPRSAKGPGWVLNPGGDGGIPTTLGWSPLEGCHKPSVAMEHAGYLMDAAPHDKGGKDAYWQGRGHELLRIMMHAAALGGATMREVAEWVRDPDATEPMAILTDDPDAAPGWATELAALRDTEPEQRDGISAAAASALAWMSDPVMADIACPEPGTGFDVWDFLLGDGTVYLISTNRPHNSVAPYVACLAAHVFDSAKLAASYSPGNRLDPPLTLVIDEPAITCPVPLDRWAAEAGGHGITVATGVQSPAQLVKQYGEAGARTIRDCASVTIVMGGYNDDKELESLSAVCGHTTVWDLVKDPSGRKTRQERTDRLYPPERIRTLTEFTAVLLHRSARPVEVRLALVWERDGYQKADTSRPVPAAATPVPEVRAIEAPRQEAIPMPAAPERPALGDGTTHAVPDLTRSDTEWLSQMAPDTARSAGTTA